MENTSGFVGKFDCLQNDYLKVAKQLGLQENLPHLRKVNLKAIIQNFIVTRLRK